MKTSWQVATAAEAFTAGQFARYGWNVSVQYGANQPEYDLIVDDGNRSFKVSVKGSKDGSWGLTQSLLKNADYHAAVDEWLKKHSRKTIFCFVQFKETDHNSMPRMYLATPEEVATRLKESAGGRGDTILYEYHKWGPKARSAGTIDELPSSWRFSKERIEEIYNKTEQ
jgi:hypothetical protein